MREKIKAIIKEVSGLGEEVEQIQNLVSKGYLDSFATLMLINSLSLEFEVKFDFDDQLFKNLDSLDTIEELIKSKKGIVAEKKILLKEHQAEWEERYSAEGFRDKNEYPDTTLVSFVMRNFGSVADRSAIKILEVGCGWGNNLTFLKDKGFDYYGMDFSATAVKHCQQKFKDVILGDIANLPYPAESFDCVLDRMALQHNPLEKIPRLFEEVQRVLKKGGIFFSIMAVKEHFDMQTTCLSKEQLGYLAGKFKGGHTLDYMERSSNNEAVISRSQILVARK